MARKKKPFKVREAKGSRLDVRVTDALRKQLETFCIDHDMHLTDAVTNALKKFIKNYLEKKPL